MHFHCFPAVRGEALTLLNLKCGPGHKGSWRPAPRMQESQLATCAQRAWQWLAGGGPALLSVSSSPRGGKPIKIALRGEERGGRSPILSSVHSSALLLFLEERAQEETPARCKALRQPTFSSRQAEKPVVGLRMPFDLSSHASRHRFDSYPRASCLPLSTWQACAQC